MTLPRPGRSQIAECLGLDPAKFQVHTDRNDDATAGHIALPSASELQRFRVQIVAGARKKKEGVEGGEEGGGAEHGLNPSRIRRSSAARATRLARSSDFFTAETPARLLNGSVGGP